MQQTCADERLYVLGVNEKAITLDQTRVSFHTTRGSFDGLACMRRGMHQGVIFLDDLYGGFEGPSSIFPDLAGDLLERGIASLRLSYRLPGDCTQCGIDALLGVQYMDDEAVRDVVLVGWSYGGAVALAAGSLARNVCGVAAISTMEVAGCCRKRLRSKPVLLIHGETDSVTSPEISRRIYYGLSEPRRLITYPGVGHGLNEARGRVCDDLTSWILDTLKVCRVAA